MLSWRLLGASACAPSCAPNRSTCCASTHARSASGRRRCSTSRTEGTLTSHKISSPTHSRRRCTSACGVGMTGDESVCRSPLRLGLCACRQRLRYLVARYGWDSSVFAWEFFNEVRWCNQFACHNLPPTACQLASQVDITQAFNVSDFAPWANEMSTYLRSIDMSVAGCASCRRGLQLMPSRAATSTLSARPSRTHWGNQPWMAAPRWTSR